MNKILLLSLVAILTLNNCNANTINETPKIVKIGGNYYKEKDGVLLPLWGLVLKIVAPNLQEDLINGALELAKSFFSDKNIKVLDDSQGDREDVEVITINAQDNDNDGHIELSSSSEDHNNDGENDDETELAEYENTENGLDSVLEKQLEYIDQFYTGDVDGDGQEN
ncbi:hypothetical protein ACFX5D_04205 [Flavobacterium sp. LB3P45]|uniref:Lipoprotein n=1 Tax=Flavobacterium fructosi TaxID=3230416 RepID=A0ABW6HJG2_9FLAO